MIDCPVPGAMFDCPYCDSYGNCELNNPEDECDDYYYYTGGDDE